MGGIESNDSPPIQYDWSLHPLRGSILRTLKNEGSPLSFKDLSLKTGIGPSLCAYHLKILDGRGMVGRSFSHRKGRRDYSYYSITLKGADALMFEEALSVKSEAAPLSSSIMLVAWRNMPRCFNIRRV